MNDERPYKQFPPEGLTGLPLPDEEQSWQKMKQLLDEEDKDRVPPPVWFRNCAGWIVLLGLLGILWIIFLEKGEREKGIGRKELRQKDSLPVPASHSNQPALPGVKEPDKPLPGQEQIIEEPVKEVERIDRIPAPITASPVTKNTAKNTSVLPRREQQSLVPVETKQKKNNKQPRALKENKSADSGTVVKQPVPPPARAAQDSSIIVKATDPLKKEESLFPQAKTDSAQQRPAVKNEEEKKKDYYFSAGLALQQQIPFAGQKANPYDRYGRKGSLADYIPSVYVRFHQDKKWFLQSEFRYGAPQSVKEIIYNSDSISDTGNVITTTTSFQLKKTFYHQLPLSFNYYVLPNWSVGAGLMYSRFQSAVSEETVRQRNNQLQRDSLLSRKLVYIKASDDSVSVFTSSQLHALIETQYQWKRFSLGLRYTQGLRPFIRYTGANGVLSEEKNKSLQIFLRYRLWKSE